MRLDLKSTPYFFVLKFIVNSDKLGLEMLPIYLYSAKTLQNWNPDTPFKTGIGGSETAHIEMHKALIKLKLPIQSFAPLERASKKWPGWKKSEFLPLNKPGIVINYRDNTLYDQPFDPGYKHWFVAQDVDYPWTEERLKKIDRYITLCTDHKNYTLSKYPSLAGKVYQSSNGVRADYIADLWKKPPARNQNQVIYASSPDRGLLFLLTHWWRIIERCPEAELKIAYGFENTNKIIQLMGGSAYHEGFRDQLFELFKQPGVTWLGRLPQDKLYLEWFKSRVWAYPCNFAETSCITCMDAQACGATPVTNDLWALDDNVDKSFGYVFQGSPQEDKLVRSYFIEAVISLLQNPGSDENRRYFADKTLEKFDWNNIAQQFHGWIKKDQQQ